MDSLNRVYIRIKPVFYTLIFEIKLQVKKFVILSLATILLLTLNSYIAYILSSFMPSIASVSVIMAFYVFIGDSILSSIIMGINSELEPLYSFYYLFSIIGYIFYPEFSTMERINPYTGRWLFPSIEGAFVVLSLIAIIFFILSSLLFKRREF